MPCRRRIPANAPAADRLIEALDTFSVADVTAFVTIGFARRAQETEPGTEREHIARWHAALSRRPSVRA